MLNKRGVVPIVLIILAAFILAVVTGVTIYEKTSSDETPFEDKHSDDSDENSEGSSSDGSGSGGTTSGTSGGSGRGSGGSGGSPPRCGDGVIDDGEQCDDGNDRGGDGCSSQCQTENPEQGEFPWDKEQFNFIMIYTDDQRFDSLWAMDITREELFNKGVSFTNAYIPNPGCCPSRASFLSGGYHSHNNGVLTNTLPNGGATIFNDKNTMPVLLQRQGYKTAMIGKYLNGYKNDLSPHIPPGWTEFLETNPGGNGWQQIDVVSGSTGPDEPGVGTEGTANEYITYYQRNQSIRFIEENKEDPFFLYISTNAPHTPARPAPEHIGLFSDYVYDAPNVLEEDVSDKPQHVRSKEGNPDAYNIDFIRRQLETLQAVDILVGDIIEKLEQENLMDETVIIFASDNGIHWGEHWLSSKGKPYEESTKVPLIFRIPGIESSTRDEIVAVNLDVPQTILSMANIDLDSDGDDLIPLLTGGVAQWNREGIFFQGWDARVRGDSPSWASWRVGDYKYTEYISGETELYDLGNDPYELESQHDNQQYAQMMQDFSREIDQRTGLRVSTPASLPDVEVGMHSVIQLNALSGQGPLVWSLFEDQLPSGLKISSEGVISGTPQVPGEFKFKVAVEDHSDPSRYRTIQKNVQEFVLNVNDGSLEQDPER